jgi:pyrroloquinoline quinone biosynthesis protein B
MPRLMLLGAAQDAGVPQCGCSCENCMAVWQEGGQQCYAVSAALLDDERQEWWLIDASPDIKFQIRLLEQAVGRVYTLQGVLITHLHSGHYIGLFQFGREVMDKKHLKVTPKQFAHVYFRRNTPFAVLYCMQLRSNQQNCMQLHCNQLSDAPGTKGGLPSF